MPGQVAQVDLPEFAAVASEAAQAHLVSAFRVLRALGLREPAWREQVRARVESAWQQAHDYQYPDEHLCGEG